VHVTEWQTDRLCFRLSPKTIWHLLLATVGWLLSNLVDNEG